MLELFYRPAQRALVLSLLDRFAFIVHFLTLYQHDFQFGNPAVVQVESVWDNGEAFFLYFFLPLGQLLPFQEQFAGAAFFVVMYVALLVLSDKNRTAPQFVALKNTVGIAEIDVAAPNTLDLGSGQHHAGLHRFQKVVFKFSFSVYEFDVLLGHVSTVLGLI